MSNTTTDEMSFYKNINGDIQFNILCKNCKKTCKQSFRATIIKCPEKDKEERKNDT